MFFFVSFFFSLRLRITHSIALLVGRMNGGLDHHLFSSSDGISNEENNEEDEEVWEDQEDSRTTSVKFTDDVSNEKTKEVRYILRLLVYFG